MSATRSIADTLDQAKDAAEAIAVDWEPLPHVVDAVQALKRGAPQVWPGRAGNLAFTQTLGDEDKTAAAFAKAAQTVALTLVNRRLVTNYLDTRAALAEYDPASESFTLTVGSQGVHTIQEVIAKHVLRIAEDKIRVITPDVGGGFGTKIFPYPEYALVAAAAQRLGRPVAWVADRIEHFLADTRGPSPYCVCLPVAYLGRFSLCFSLPFTPYFPADPEAQEVAPNEGGVPEADGRAEELWNEVVPRTAAD